MEGVGTRNPRLLDSKACVLNPHLRFCLLSKRSRSLKGHCLFVVSIIISLATETDVTQLGRLPYFVGGESEFLPTSVVTELMHEMRYRSATGQRTLDLTFSPPHHIKGKVKMGIM